jgi:ribosomal protein S18 acetylase RimI-like enzyme
MTTIIRRYTDQDEQALFAMMEQEGSDWSDYFGNKGRQQYIAALKASITLVMFEQNELCAYARIHEDGGFGVYVYDLLVGKNYRGKGYGKALMSHVKTMFPEQSAYVMSDVDEYYCKLGYDRIGSIFEIG